MKILKIGERTFLVRLPHIYICSETYLIEEGVKLQIKERLVYKKEWVTFSMTH